MTTIIAKNTHAIAIDGTSDDADVVLNQLFADPLLKQKYSLTSINSINIARILLQTAHFFYSYLRLAKTIDESVVFYIPSGGFGNGTAGLIARKMGLN